MTKSLEGVWLPEQGRSGEITFRSQSQEEVVPPGSQGKGEDMPTVGDRLHALGQQISAGAMQPKSVGAPEVKIEMIDVGRMQLQPSLNPTPRPNLEGTVKPCRAGLEA